MKRIGLIVGGGLLLGGVILTYPMSTRDVQGDTSRPPPSYQERQDTLRRGETLSDLFTRQGVEAFTVVDLVRSLGLDPRRVREGLVFHFRQAVQDSTPSIVVVRTSPEARIRLYRASTGWTGIRESIQWVPEVVRVAATVEQSLYTALERAIADSVLGSDERTRLAWDVAEIYAWSIDFSRDIQANDSLTLVIERLVSEEGDTRLGRVLAAELWASGRRMPAFRYADAGGHPGYFDDEANSLRRAFLRAPVEFRRISSSFSRSRYHPILKIRRRHEGTDYSATSGTPVMAAGDGRVIRAGRAGGYGNLVEIRHVNGITTRYAHLRRFASGIRVGRVVRQSDVIGYVGRTGLASAPHLHYEFRVHGVARDSRRVDLGDGKPLAEALRDGFFTERDRLHALLTLLPRAGPVRRIAD